MSRWVVHPWLPWLGGWRSTGQEKGSVPFSYKHGQSDHKGTGRAKGWGGLGGLKEMSVILPRKLPWGSDQHGGSSGVPTAIFILTPLQEDPALQALVTPSSPAPHSFPPAGGPQTAFRLVQCVFHPKPHLINWVELELNTSPRVIYRGVFLAGDGCWLFTVQIQKEHQSHLPHSCLALQAGWRCGLLMNTGEETLLSCLFQALCFDDDWESSLGNWYMAGVIYLAGMMFLQLLKADQDVRKTPQVLSHLLLQPQHVPLKDQFVLTCISPITPLSSGKVSMLQVNIDAHAEN